LVYEVAKLDNSIHCMIFPERVDELTKVVDGIHARNKDSPLKLVIVKPGESFDDEFLSVRYVPIDELRSLPVQGHLQKLAGKERDTARKNRRIDLGHGNWRNSGRDNNKGDYGIAKPRHFAGTHDTENHPLINACCRIFNEYSPGYKEAYSDPERQEKIAFQNKWPKDFGSGGDDGSDGDDFHKVENITFALTYLLELLYSHFDGNNENNRTDFPSYQKVFGNASYYEDLKTGEVVRFVVLAYAAKSAGEYLHKLKRYEPWLKHAIFTHEELDKEFKEVSADFFPSATGPEAKEGRFLDQVHLQKAMFFYPFAEVIHRLFEKYPAMKEDARFLSALVLPCIASNRPQDFYQEACCLLKDGAKLGGKEMEYYTDKPLELCVEFYSVVFEACRGNKSWNYPTSHRHQPAHTPRSAIEGSWRRA